MTTKDRKLRSDAKATSRTIGQQRMADQYRRCPVPNCRARPKDYSRYCGKHALNLKSYGHPTLRLNIRSTVDYQNCLKVGRWLREAMTENDMDRRAWMRVETGLMRLAKNHGLKHPIPVIARNNGSWRNEYKALCTVSKRLDQIAPEEMIAAYLGLSAVIIEFNDVMVNHRQKTLMLNKAGGRAATRHIKITAMDPDRGRAYRYRPSPGTYTRIGKVMNDAISKEFGNRWYKEAEIKLVTRHHRRHGASIRSQE